MRFHICGNITRLLDGLATAPLDVLDVDRVVDLVAVRRKMSARVSIGCNIDPVSGLLSARLSRSAGRRRVVRAGR